MIDIIGQANLLPLDNILIAENVVIQTMQISGDGSMGEIKYKSIFILFVLMIYLSINTTVSAESYTYPELTAETAVLMDAKTGQVLFEKNMNEKKYPASITKIMTGMLALEKGNLSDILTMSKEAVFSIGRNTSHIALDVEEELTLEQALYAVSISSANDAANGIAEYISGDLESFAQLMNKRAIESGAMNTNFVNSHGLPDSNHYTTAYDMAKIIMEAIKNPKFREIFSKIRYEMPFTNKQSETRYFHCRNSLLQGKYQYDGIIASKSGWTSQANHTLVTAAKRGNRELIAVVMDNQSLNSNYEDTIKLLDHGFHDFLDVLFNVADLETKKPANFNNIEDLNLKPDENIAILLHKSLSVDDLEANYEVLESDSNEAVKVKLLLNLKQPNNFMYTSLGYIFLEAETSTEDIEDFNMDSKSTKNYFFSGLGLICIIIGFRKRRSNRKRKMYLYRNFRS
ncbi:MAG: D-alanyl-D-alanine carboxypeptidase family protein [Bacillota bacterium]|nr:D-alanyl-D-alanine carboxypeptidase family protein [Bacillota bacterium]